MNYRFITDNRGNSQQMGIRLEQSLEPIKSRMELSIANSNFRQLIITKTASSRDTTTTWAPTWSSGRPELIWCRETKQAERYKCGSFCSPASLSKFDSVILLRNFKFPQSPSHHDQVLTILSVSVSYHYTDTVYFRFTGPDLLLQLSVFICTSFKGRFTSCFEIHRKWIISSNCKFIILQLYRSEI